MKRLPAAMWGGAAVALISFAISLHLVTITDGVTAVVSDGAEWYKSGNAVHAHAILGMGVSAVAFLAIIVGAVLGRRPEKHTVTFGICFGAVSGMAFLSIVSTYVQYSGVFS